MFGAIYFGQYWIGIASPTPPAPPSPAISESGGGPAFPRNKRYAPIPIDIEDYRELVYTEEQDELELLTIISSYLRIIQS